MSALNKNNRSPNTTVTCFEEQAPLYDTYQNAVVPHYKTALEMVGMTVERYVNKIPKIIDLGCGTGNSSYTILSSNPKAQFYLIDGSAASLTIALKKISSVSADALIGSRTADLLSPDWSAGIDQNSYDAIVSTFVLEHLPPEIYRAVLSRCCGLLKPGGWLIAVEGYAEKESDLIEWFEGKMQDNLQNIRDPELADFVSQLRSRHEKHYFTSKQEKQIWWKQSGLSNIHVVWQYLCIGLMAGQKP